MTAIPRMNTLAPAAFFVSVSLTVASLVCRPDCPVAWCPSVPCEPCDEARCAAIETAVCERTVGEGAVALSWCQVKR
jgi:hypothetical protein